MPTPSIYQQFLRAAWIRFKRDYPFVTRFEKSFCVAIPKSSSFILGRSPQNGKYFVLDFQHHPKPWGAGQFAINVHISAELVPTKNFSAHSGYEDAEDGYYRLALHSIGYDKWWCLMDRDRSQDEEEREFNPDFDPSQADREFFDEKWRPTVFENTEAVIQEALEDTFGLIESEVLARFGFSLRKS